MSLVFDLLSSINDPNKQGSIEQLSSTMGSIQDVAKAGGMSPDAMQGVMSTLGSALRPAMKQKAAMPGGGSMLEGMLGQMMGGGNTNALSSLLSPQMQNQLVQTVSQKTGLPSPMLQAAMPGLLQSAMGFFNMGASKPGVASAGMNPLLKSFLDSDNDSDVDLGDVMKYAGRFLNAPGR